jgi:hypothetical protein
VSGAAGVRSCSGITPVWVNRDGADWPAAASPQPLTVRSLAELATLLD